jgi:hypothetical protein
MPRFDRTGPNGQGPMTGRGLGNCNPDAIRTQNQDKPIDNEASRPYPRFLGWARGFGRGFGFGRGMRLGGGFGRSFRSGRGGGYGNFRRNGW